MGKGNVPFSWEDMPGVSKAEMGRKPIYFPANKLPPPPCPRSQEARKISLYGTQNIPLPPCTFRPPPPVPSQRIRSSKDDDPFLVAYRECTKSTREASKLPEHGPGSGSIRKHLFSLSSCKRSCSVRDGNLVRVRHSLRAVDRNRCRMETRS